MVAKLEGIDIMDNLIRHVHFTIQICSYRCDLAGYLMNYMAGFVKTQILEMEGMNYLDYLSKKTARYATYAV